MHGPLFGEFMGTMVLILLGDGVVANVLLKKSKGEGSGWIVITTGWGLAVMAGIFTAIACGSPGAHINPAVTLAVALLSHNWATVIPFWIAQFAGSLCRRNPGVAGLSPALERDPGPGREAGHLLHRPGNSQSSRELPDRNHRDDCLVTVGFAFGSTAVSATGLHAGLRSLSVGHAGMGARPVPGWTDWICHEPCS